jgi:hypothetical protein
MKNVSTIRARAAKRKGGDAKLVALLPRSATSITVRPGARLQTRIPPFETDCVPGHIGLELRGAK